MRSGVLDVAGGGTSGLSVHLSIVHDIRSTVIDPRPLNLTNKKLRKIIDDPSHSNRPLPRHIAMLWESPATETSDKAGSGGSGSDDVAVAGCVNGGGSDKNKWFHSRDRIWYPCESSNSNSNINRNSSGGGSHLEEERHEQDVIMDSNASAASSSKSSGSSSLGDVNSPNSVEQLSLNASIIIGCHPDQATEGIVAAAMRYNRDFAVGKLS
jgi:hypothetical protein